MVSTPPQHPDDAALLALLDAHLEEAARDPVVTGEAQLSLWRQYVMRPHHTEVAFTLYKAARLGYREMADALVAATPEQARPLRRVLKPRRAETFFFTPLELRLGVIAFISIAALSVGGVAALIADSILVAFLLPVVLTANVLIMLPTFLFQNRTSRMPLDDLLQFLTAHYRYDAWNRLQRCRAILQPLKTQGEGEAAS